MFSKRIKTDDRLAISLTANDWLRLISYYFPMCRLEVSEKGGVSIRLGNDEELAYIPVGSSPLDLWTVSGLLELIARKIAKVGQ